MYLCWISVCFTVADLLDSDLVVTEWLCFLNEKLKVFVFILWCLCLWCFVAFMFYLTQLFWICREFYLLLVGFIGLLLLLACFSVESLRGLCFAMLLLSVRLCLFVLFVGFCFMMFLWVAAVVCCLIPSFYLLGVIWLCIFVCGVYIVLTFVGFLGSVYRFCFNCGWMFASCLELLLCVNL